MKNRPFAIGLAIAIVLIALAVWGMRSAMKTDTIDTPEAPIAAGGLAFDNSISDGSIIVSYPGDRYSLAVRPDQILAKAYIPPCDDGFQYCLYATSTAYQGTNFESAGLRIEKRKDLASERACLDTPPEGYDAATKPDVSTTSAQYSSSAFMSVGDAGAGHYASGSLYRLFYRPGTTCYELEERIGETQFANYPAGSRTEFTAADRTALKAELDSILARITLQTGHSDLFEF